MSSELKPWDQVNQISEAGFDPYLRRNAPSSQLIDTAALGSADNWLNKKFQQVRSDPFNSWTALPKDWFSYSSATVINVAIPATIATSAFVVGDKLRILQNGSYSYFYVIDIGNTTITITGGSDYTFTNAAIQGIDYSRLSRPLGFPASFNFAANPTATGAATWSLGIGTIISRFFIQGGYVFLDLYAYNTSLSVDDNLLLTLPVSQNNQDAISTSKLYFDLFILSNNFNITTGGWKIDRTSGTIGIYTKMTLYSFQEAAGFNTLTATTNGLGWEIQCYYRIVV